MLFTGWEVGIGRNCARGTASGFKSFRKICLSLQPMCVEEGRVSVDVQSARSIANQNKTLQHDF